MEKGIGDEDYGILSIDPWKEHHPRDDTVSPPAAYASVAAEGPGLMEDDGCLMG